MSTFETGERMQRENKVRRGLMRILTLMTALLMLCPSASAASVKAKINSSSARVYKSMSANSASVKGLKNLTVTVTSYKNGWAQVKYKGHTGYIKTKHLNLTNRIKAYTSRAANVYRGAGSGKMGTLKKGATVYVVGVNGSYSRIQNASRSVTGYIRTGDLTATKPKVTTGSSSSSGNSGKVSSVPAGLASTTSSISSSSGTAKRLEYAIYLAQKQLGKPYRSNANPPSSFNCSMLMYYCYEKAGFDMEDSAHEQGYDSEYRKVSYSDLRRGDMVCFDTNTGDDDQCDHTGIYLGKGYFIHASSSAGRVIITNMETDSHSYYKKAFSWGRRIS